MWLLSTEMPNALSLFNSLILYRSLVCRVTRCPEYLFNIWPFATLKICPTAAKTFAKVGLKCCLHSKWVLKNGPNGRVRQNFAQSYHTACSVSQRRRRQRRFYRWSRLKRVLKYSVDFLSSVASLPFARKWTAPEGGNNFYFDFGVCASVKVAINPNIHSRFVQNDSQTSCD